MRKVFTTGQVAKLCKVAPRTVSKWFDSGRLVGYRIPGSQDRRIPREHLIRFLKEHSMPLGALETEVYKKVLLVTNDRDMMNQLTKLLPATEDYQVGHVNDGFDAGLEIQSTEPDAIVLDFSLGRGECLQIAAKLRNNPTYETMVIVGVASEDEADPDALKGEGFSDVFKKPFDHQLLVASLERSIRQKKDKDSA